MKPLDPIDPSEQPRHWHGPDDAVKQAVASAELDGHEVDPDWVGVLHRVASGELSADDAVQVQRERAGIEVTEQRLHDMRSLLARLMGYPEGHGEHLTDEFLLENVTSWVRRGMRTPADGLAVGGPWRLSEWEALPDVCLIAGCDASETDPRGPVFLRDGSIHKACQEHWEGVHSVLGQQAGSGDAYRSSGDPGRAGR